MLLFLHLVPQWWFVNGRVVARAAGCVPGLEMHVRQSAVDPLFPSARCPPRPPPPCSLPFSQQRFVK